MSLSLELPKSRSIACSVLLALLLPACWKTKTNPRYCDGATLFCADPVFPYCDVPARQCESTPPDGFSTDMLSDAAPVCVENSGCNAAGKPICDSAQRVCRACVKGSPSAECAAFAGRGVCAASGDCVECESNQDCAAAGKTCRASTLTCVPCQANAECASGACRADHVCAAQADLLYVDNKSGTCTGTHAGTLAEPFCQVAPALLAPGSTILVAGSNTDYDAIAVTTALDKAIVGPGRTATPVARFAQAMKSGVSLISTTGIAKLSLAGVVIIGSSGGLDAPGVACTQPPGTTASLTVARSLIRKSGLHAVDSNACALTLDANEITLNTGGGVKVNGGSYTITNNIIAGNGNITTGAVPGFAVDITATGTFAYNTVAKNLVSSGIGGVDCSTATHPLSASIVTQNTAGSQFSGACTFTNVVAGTTETATGPTKLDPAFVSASNFRLDMTPGAAKTANEACCVDQLTSGSSDHDVDSAARPIRTKWDIGAFEAP